MGDETLGSDFVTLGLTRALIVRLDLPAEAYVSAFEVGVPGGAGPNVWVVTTIASEVMPVLRSPVPSEEMLLFGWEACCCWTTASSDCRALQALMSSYQV